MFCGKCGNTLKEGAQFCPKCGAQAMAAPAATPAARAAKPKKKMKKSLVITVLIAAAAVITAGSIGISLLTAPPEDAETVAAKYLDAVMDVDYDGMNRYLAMPYDKLFPEMLEVYEKQVKKAQDEEDSYSLEYAKEQLKTFQLLSEKETVKKAFSQLSGILNKSRKEAYGKDYTRTVEVINTDVYTKSEKNKALQSLKSTYTDVDLRISNYFPINKVEEMATLTCEVSEEGAEDFGSFEMTITLICVDGKYKVLETSYPMSVIISTLRNMKSDTSMDDFSPSDLDEPLKSMLGG